MMTIFYRKLGFVNTLFSGTVYPALEVSKSLPCSLLCTNVHLVAWEVCGIFIRKCERSMKKHSGQQMTLRCLGGD